MAKYEVEAPDGQLLTIEGPEGAPDDVIRQVAAQNYVPVTPDTGFGGSAKSSMEKMKGEGALLLGKLGLMDEDKAESYYKRKAKLADAMFKPTEKGWDEDPVTKFKELLGSSLPYMAAPLIGAAGVAALPEEIAGITLGAVGAPAIGGFLTNALQFTGTNLGRQVDEGSTLKEADTGAAVAAAIPQSIMDIATDHMLPGVRSIFKRGGVNLTEKEAKEVAKDQLTKQVTEDATTGVIKPSITQRAMGYGGKALQTAAIEGVNEAGQQVLERMQAGLSLDDPKAMQEYFDNFIGGAVLGGTIAVPGHFYEKNVEEPRRKKMEELQAQAEERKKQYKEMLAQQQADYERQKAEAEAAGQTIPEPPKPLALPAPEARNHAPSIQNDVLFNPTGNFSETGKMNTQTGQWEVSPLLGDQATKKVNEVRELEHGKPALKEFSVEDLIRSGYDRQYVNGLLTNRWGFNGEKLKTNDVLKTANNKGIETGTDGFNDFITRVTGQDAPRNQNGQKVSAKEHLNMLTPAEKFAVNKALEEAPTNPAEGKTILQEGSNATDWHDADYHDATNAVLADIGKNGELSVKDVLNTIQQSTFLGKGLNPQTADAQRLLDEMIRRGEVGKKYYTRKDSDPSNPSYYTTIVPATPSANTPAGLNIQREHLGQGRAARAAYTYTDEAGNKVSFPTLQAAEEHAIRGLNDHTLQEMIKNAAADAAGGDLHPLSKRYAEIARNELIERQGLGKARGILIGKGEGKVRTEMKAGEEERLAKSGIKTAETQRKETEAREAEAKAKLEEAQKIIEAKREKLAKELTTQLRKFGLEKVALRVLDSIANGGADGEYARQVISIALDAENPMGEMRHEVIHALRAMGAFTDDEWRILQNKAKTEWVNRFMKGVQFEGPLSKYDAYKEVYEEEHGNLDGFEDYIQEEAIAEAFKHYSHNAKPAGLIGNLFTRLNEFLRRLGNAMRGLGFKHSEDIFGRIERGEQKTTREDLGEERKFAVNNQVSPALAKHDDWKATPIAKKMAETYAKENGIMPYLSEGQIKVPVTPVKYSLKLQGKHGEDPSTGLPLNKNGTVTLYHPTTAENARRVNNEKRLIAQDKDQSRIYLTNESSGWKTIGGMGNMPQRTDGSVVRVEVDPNLLHIDQEYDDGRKDFFIPIKEGDYFNKKMRLWAMYAERNKPIEAATKYTELGKSFAKGIQDYLDLSPAEQKIRLREIKQILKRDHNVGKLLGENGKLEKTRVGDYGLTYDGKSVASQGLGLASAQKLNDKVSSCPNSAICEGLCLGDTSGNNMMYGGMASGEVAKTLEKTSFRAGPRLSQYLKTEAMMVHPEEFAILLHDEISKFEKWAAKNDYQSAIRLNVTSDIPPKFLKPIIDAHPNSMFYDYTKLDSATVAPNHHLTYSSTGASQIVNGEKVVNRDQNWDKMMRRLDNGDNVAMAFTSKTDMPKFVKDEASGKVYQVWNGDNYDARFLDPKRKDGKGMIVGLTNKAATLKSNTAAKETNGFFIDYDKARDGDTAVIKDQNKIAPKVIPISGGKFSLKKSGKWYFSQLEQKIEESPDRIFNKAPQIKAWLTSNAPKLGIKSEELQFSGINDWLDLQGDKKVSKEDVLNYLKQGGVQLEEVKRSENKNETRYEDYQLDGGTNYQEMLLTLPSKLPDGWSVKELNMTNKASSVRPFEVYDGDELIGMGDSRQDAIDDAFRRKDLKGIDVKRPNEFRSSHFQAPNILAHIRMNDRKDPNGNKVLFIEEIQSDWHQTGRKRGYEEPIPQNLSPSDLLWEYGPKLSEKQKNDLRDFIERYELGNIDTLVNEDLISREQYTKLIDLARQSLDDEYKNWLKNQKTVGVPNAPFKDTKAWTGLALKSIISYAAENGYEKVAFINGEQSADRYDLSKQISQLSVQRNATDFTINAIDRDGHPAIYKSVPTLIDLDELVGKDLAEKIKDDFANKSGNRHEYSGLDLKVGGKGMIDYYNNILPQVAKDVLRKIDGGNLEKVTVPVRVMVPANVEFKYTVVSDLSNDNAYVKDNKTGERATETMSYDEAKDWLRSHDPATTGQQTGFSITDKIRNKVAEGLPLFSLKPKRLTTVTPQVGGAKAMQDTIKGVWDDFHDASYLEKLRSEWVNPNSGLANRLSKMETYDQKGQLRADLLRNAYAQVVNVIHNIVQGGLPALNRDGTIGAKLDAHNALANSRLIAKKLDGKIVDLNGDVMTGMEAVGEIARYKRGEEIMQEDASYNALQTNPKKFRNRELEVTPEMIAWADEQMKNHPEVKEVFAIWKSNNTALVDLWEKVGMLTKDMADAFRNKKFYVSLAMSDSDLEEMRANTVNFISSGLKSVGKIHALKGATNIRNIWENVEKQTASMIAAAYQNNVRKISTEQLNYFDGAHISAILNPKTGQLVANPKNENVNLRYKDFTNPLADKDGVVHVIVKNKNDLAAFESFHYEMTPIMKLFSGANRFLRAGALLNPMFWIRQLIKDPIHATMVTNSGIVTPLHSMGRFIDIIRKDSESARILASRGVIGQMDTTVDLQSYLREAGVELKPSTKFQDMMHRLHSIHEASDAATRVAIFDDQKAKALARGLNEEQAIDYAVMKARESINFNVHGNGKLLNQLRHMIPFLSASINSLDTLYRAYTGKGIGAEEREEAKRLFVNRATMMFFMCSVYAMMMSQDDEYKKLPAYVRDNNWLIKNPTGEGFIKVPTPFEVGFLFKTLPEGLINTLAGNQTGHQMLQAYGDGLMQNLPGSGVYVPQLFKPVLENVTNHSFFTGNTIESAGDQQLPVEMRGRNASETAKALSKVGLGKIGLSPAKIDNLFQGYFAELGTLGAGTADKLLYFAEGKTPPAVNLAKQPFFKSFLTDPNADRAVADFYSLEQNANQVAQEFAKLKAEGRGEEIKEFVSDKEKAMQLSSAPTLRRIGTNMTAIRKQIAIIQEDQNRSPEERRDLINKLTGQYNRIAEQGVKVANAYGLSL